MQRNLLLLLGVLLGACAALPITSKPYGLSPDHLAWDTFGDSYGDVSLEPSADGYDKPRKILPKSIFIAPTLNANPGSTCGPGFTTDHLGNCIQTVQINHHELLLDHLNQLLAHRNQNEKDQDLYDYDYDVEVTSPSGKDAPKGPFQLTIPVQLETDAASPAPPTQPHQRPDPLSGSGTTITTTTPQPPVESTTTSTTTTSTTTSPLVKLTSFIESLLPHRLGHTSSQTARVPAEEQVTTTTTTTTTLQEVETTTMSAAIPSQWSSRFGGETEETTVSPGGEGDVSVTEDHPQSQTQQQQQNFQYGSSWSTSEFATELASEQLVPVTSTSWAETATPADAPFAQLSNAEESTAYDDEVEVTTTQPRLATAEDWAVTSEISSSSSWRPDPEIVSATTTTSYAPEATETVLPVQATERPQLLASSQFAGSAWSAQKGGGFDWRSKPISIVTPVPNPFPFQRNTGSLFQFTVPVTTHPHPRTTTESPTTADLVLGVESESENSQKVSQQQEVNYENGDVDNRFIYHHGAPSSSSAGTANSDAPPTTSPFVVATGGAASSSSSSFAWSTSTTPRTSTPSFAEKLAALLRPKESDRRRVYSGSLWSFTTTTPRPATTTTTTARSPFSFAGFSTTTSRYENFLRSSSSRIRFPGPSVNRQPAPNKLIPNGQRSSHGGGGASVASVGGEKKPFWWFPSGWEVDTKQKEKPVLLRFWSKMPLIPDDLATQRRANFSRSARENSKSPSESLYREVAIQDISKAFQERQEDGGSS